MLANALGVAHRAAFTRCRILLGLPDEVWLLGDTLDLPEDELLRIAKIESPEESIAETRRIAANVATRNISDETDSKQKTGKKSAKPPTLFTDTAHIFGQRRSLPDFLTGLQD